MGKMKHTPATPPQPDFGKKATSVGMGPQGNMFGTSAKGSPQSVISKSEAAIPAKNQTMVKKDLTSPCD